MLFRDNDGDAFDDYMMVLMVLMLFVLFLMWSNGLLVFTDFLNCI